MPSILFKIVYYDQFGLRLLLAFGSCCSPVECMIVRIFMLLIGVFRIIPKSGIPELKGWSTYSFVRCYQAPSNQGYTIFNSNCNIWEAPC